MKTEADRLRALAQIKSNVERFGFHVYLISGGKVPRFAYTIGLTNTLGFELLLCGATFYSAKQVSEIVTGVARELRQIDGREMSAIRLGELGSFLLRPADSSWTRHMMLGAIDYLESEAVRGCQIVPDEEHWTLDIPDASKTWDAAEEPIWAALDGRWEMPINPKSSAVTNLAALRGEPVTEAAHWEIDQWELFAGPGPDVEQREMRVVPMSTMLGIDLTLMPVVKLEVGAALWRQSVAAEWQVWKSIK